MLYRYIKEFIAICSYLEENGTPCRKGFMLIKRETLERLLNKNAYETANNKLKTWKALHWINAENRRLTHRVYENDSQKRLPYIWIDIKVFQMLKQLDSS